MQRHLRPADAGRIEGRDQRGREVQARRRRGHRTFACGEDRLVVVLVTGLRGRALDVGRQRHAAMRLQGRHQRRIGAIEAQADLAPVMLGQNRGGEIRAEDEDVAGHELLRRPREAVPGIGAAALVQRHVDARRAASSRQLRLDHARVVAHEHRRAGRPAIRGWRDRRAARRRSRAAARRRAGSPDAGRSARAAG